METIEKIKNLNAENIGDLTQDEISEIVSFIESYDKKYELLTYMIDESFSEALTDEEEYAVPVNYKKIMKSFIPELEEIDNEPNKYNYEDVI